MKKYNVLDYRVHGINHAEKTIFDNLGREEAEVNYETECHFVIDIAFSEIRKVLGYQLYIEWLFVTDFISKKEYSIIRVNYKDSYNTENCKYYNGRGLGQVNNPVG